MRVFKLREDFAEPGRRPGGAAQAGFEHLFLRDVGAFAAHFERLAVPVKFQHFQVAQLESLLGAVEAALLPDQRGDVFHQHVLDGVGGLAAGHETVAKGLKLARVLAQQQHALLQGVPAGVAPVLEGVQRRAALAGFGARPGGFLGVSAV